MHLQHFAGEIILGKDLIPRLTWPSVPHFLSRTAILDYFTSKTIMVLGQVIGVDNLRCLYILPTFQLIRYLENIGQYVAYE
jgi:hypothetical protein